MLDIDEADPVHDHAKAGDTKGFWEYIKAKHRDPDGIAFLKSHGKEFTKPEEKVNILNEQHNSAFTPKPTYLNYPIALTQTCPIFKLTTMV